MPSTVWKGYLSFGLVAIPIRLFAAARSKTTRFHLLHDKDLSRVHEVLYCSAEEKPLDRSDLVKGYEVSKNQYVVVEDSELKNVAPPTATGVEIIQFANAEEIDPLLFEKSYYVAPEKNAEKPYSLLRFAMAESRNCAVAKLSMHSREYTVIIRPTEESLILHTMYYADELHAASRVVSRTNRVNRKQLDLARKLIQSLKAPFKLEQFHDEYRRNIERLIAQKRKGQKITRTERPRRTPVIDIAEALQKSISENTARRSKQRGSAKKHRVA
jgi:DNA end-binding protein Ku